MTRVRHDSPVVGGGVYRFEEQQMTTLDDLEAEEAEVQHEIARIAPKVREEIAALEEPWSVAPSGEFDYTVNSPLKPIGIVLQRFGGVEQKVVAYPAARSVSEAIELARHECQAERAAYNAFVADIYAKHGANKLLTSLRAVQASIVRWKDEERQMMTVRVVAKSGKPPVGPIPWADAAKVDVSNGEFRVVKQPKPVPKKMPRYIPSTPEEAEARRKAGLDKPPDRSGCLSS
jgi:hypothetical protein